MRSMTKSQKSKASAVLHKAFGVGKERNKSGKLGLGGAVGKWGSVQKQGLDKIRSAAEDE